MRAPPQKDWLDIAIDFFFGAAFFDVLLLGAYFRANGRWYNLSWGSFELCLLAATCIAGSLAALYRNQFWSRWEHHQVIPPMEESVSRAGRIILWSIFAVGCGALWILISRLF